MRRNLISSQYGRLRRPSRSRSNLRTPPQFQIEELENRRTLSVNATYDGTSGYLTVRPTDSAVDVLTISSVGGNVAITNNGASVPINFGATIVPSALVRQMLVDVGGGNDTVNLAGVTSATFSNSILNGNILIFGGDGADNITGSSLNDVITGGGGGDIINGGDGNDKIDGGVTYGAEVFVGALAAPPEDALDEASGVVISRDRADTMWLIDDDAGARLFANRPSNGTSIGSWIIAGANNQDWEDIAYYRNLETGNRFVYIADIGGSTAVANPHRAGGDGNLVVIYRVDEPAPGVAPTLNGFVRLDPSGSGIRDFESLMVDPATGEIYLISRNEGAGVAPRLYKAQTVPTEANWTGNATISLVDQGSLNFDGSDASGADNGEVRGADIAPDGNGIVLSTEDWVYYYSRQPGATVREVLVGANGQNNREADRFWSRIGAANGGQAEKYEGVSFAQDSSYILITAESAGSPVLRYPVSDQADADILTGGNGNDGIVGRGGNDLAYGGSGSDFIFGDQGNDTLYGESGSDTYGFSGSNLGADVISSELANVDTDTVDFTFFDSSINSLNLSITTQQVVSAGNLSLTIALGTALENVVGSRFADNIVGNSRNNYIQGNLGNDTIRLGDGHDTAYGGSGDDMIWGGTGSDYINGGDGFDIAYGGVGGETLGADLGVLVENWNAEGPNA